MRWGGVQSRRIQFAHPYEGIISVENLLAGWREFVRGKRTKRDVQEFQHRLMDNILELHRDLKGGTYRHGGYHAFKINDPKPRDTHKASIRDRLVHHALYRKLYPFFDRSFVADSYSCRKGKGTHKAMNRFRSFAYKVSKNHTRTCWVLKCDIRKFFASIDQTILLDIVRGYIPDERINTLITKVVHSFRSNIPISTRPRKDRDIGNGPVRKAKPSTFRGLPLGNLTSQLLVNIYMNEFDQFMKHTLKTKYYVRYADDFVVLSSARSELVRILSQVRGFLDEPLNLELHPGKVYIKTFASGVDFLGWVHFSDHRVLRAATKRRMIRNLSESAKQACTDSYQGMLRHGNAHTLSKQINELLSADDILRQC